MTYCLAAIVNDGMVFMSDSRTNAGIDQLGVYSKMHVFDEVEGRFFALLSAGNLATTQAVVAQIRRDLREDADQSLATCKRLRDACEYIGVLSQAVQEKYTAQSESDTFNAEANFIFGGQILGQETKLFQIYPQGNFVEPTALAPFLQIGEQKYGKPILDRIIRSETSLETVALCGLVSMDSTIRSNAGVGPPIELLIYRNDTPTLALQMSFDEGDPYWLKIRATWEQNLRDAFANLPALDMPNPTFRVVDS